MAAADVPFLFAFDVSRDEVLISRLAVALADAGALPLWAAWWGGYVLYFGLVALCYAVVWRFAEGDYAEIAVKVWAGAGLLDAAVRVARLVWLWWR